MGILMTSHVSGTQFTTGSDYGDVGTSGINEFTNRINVESGLLGGVSGALVNDVADLVAVSGAGVVVSGAGVAVSGAVTGGVHDRDTNIAAPTTTSATYEDVANIINNLTTKGYPVFVAAMATGKSSDANGELHMRISEGVEGAETDNSVGVFVKGVNEAGLCTMDTFQPAADTPTEFHVQFRTNGTGTGTLDQITLIVIELKGYAT